MSELADARLAVQHDLSRVFAGARDVRDATPGILESVGRGLGCVVSEMWVVDSARPVLRSMGTWASDARFRAFVESETAFEFAFGRGLPGRVWARAEPQWMSDVTSDEVFERRLPAIACGVRAAVAFPMVFRGAVVGVIQFFYDHTKQPDGALVEMFADIGEQLGLFLERARVDALAARQAEEILELSAPILGVSPRAILLPIIGTLDGPRAEAVTQRLLARVGESSPEIVILDLTSAGTLDTFMARRLLDAIAAVRVLGAEVMLTGVRPSAARALVLLGISLEHVRTYATLAQGLAHVR